MANKSINKCICEFCGKEYITRNPRSICCRDIQCLKAANHKVYSALSQGDFKYINVCEVCGENYWTNTKKAKCCNNGYCSGSMGILSPIKKGFDPKDFHKVQCKQCGNMFTGKYGKSSVFCSAKCIDNANSDKLKETMNKLEAEFVGQKFGKVTVDYLTRETRNGKTNAVICYYTCECGGNGSCRADILRDSVARNCGCSNASMFDNPGHSLPLFLRRKISTWITNSRNNYDSICDITGVKGNTAIHHLYPFANIVFESIDISGLPLMEVSEYTKEELRYLTDIFLKLHNEYPAGVCVSEGLHYLFHGIYGSKDFTPEDYYEFKERCLNGEFGDLSEYNRSKRKDDGEVKQCYYCGTTEGKIFGENGKLGNNYCQKHYGQMITKGYCYEVPPSIPKVKPEPRKTASGYPGVSWWSHGSKWKAMIRIDGKRTSLGYYKELKDAIAVRKEAEHKYA